MSEKSKLIRKCSVCKAVDRDGSDNWSRWSDEDYIEQKKRADGGEITHTYCLPCKEYTLWQMNFVGKLRGFYE